MADSNHEKKLLRSVFGAAMKRGEESEPGIEDMDRESFNRRQEQVFSNAAEFFASDEAVPEDVRERLYRIVRLGLTDRERVPGARFLDVGAGCGVLSGILLDENTDARVTAVDFSEKMLTVLKSRYPSVMTISGDVLDLVSPAAYDCVWFNACFGNLFDPAAVVRHLAGQMSYGAMMHISHPMGRDFQVSLHEKDPLTVPHKLPGDVKEAEAVAAGSGLEFVRLVNEADLYLLSYRLV